MHRGPVYRVHRGLLSVASPRLRHASLAEDDGDDEDGDDGDAADARDADPDERRDARTRVAAVCATSQHAPLRLTLLDKIVIIMEHHRKS